MQNISASHANAGYCCQTPTFYYDIYAVYDPDGALEMLSWGVGAWAAEASW